MANPAWTASGDYFETCTCDYLCPCLSSNLTASPTKGDCVFAFAFRVDRGRFGDVSLDGLCFALAGVAPGPMGDGNWSVGLIVDDRADAAQEKAIAATASGEAGGPLAALAPLIASFRGVEKKSIRFEASKYVPSIQDSVVEYELLGRSGEPPQLDVLLVAAPNDMVNSRVAAIEKAGLEPIAVDIEAFALLRSLGRGGFSNLIRDVARFHRNLARPLFRPKV